MNASATLTFTAQGDILSTNAEAVRTELSALAGRVEANGAFDIDLRACRLVDSVGLNLLVTVIKQCRQRNVAVRLVVAHANLLRILTFTRLGQHATIVDEVRKSTP